MGLRCLLQVTLPDGSTRSAEVNLGYCNWVRAYQCEIWDNLDPISGSSHHYKVLSQMGKQGSITRIPQMDDALKISKQIKVIDVLFKENATDDPYGYLINPPAFDDSYTRSYQVPHSDIPNSNQNTVYEGKYQINFQRGWFLDVKDVKPVRYENAMMESKNPFFRPQPNDPALPRNIVEMQWILQREMGGSLVYFHQVNVTPGSFEGIHQHIGSEELYYIVSGEGTAYMGHDDDPAFADSDYPIVAMEIYCIGEKPVREIPVGPGKVIYTKSGGIHGIRNTSDSTPLIFVAFGYHCS
jgi:oxalate decarboxylase/phosphoglucose isomerase-like protein (cupin superfamily)